MQNEDEEFERLEEKLGRLTPKGMDEAYLLHLTQTVRTPQEIAGVQQSAQAYPSNVLWMRFAPVAAAAGVVLLGTFFLRYESRMEGLQAQQDETATAPKMILNDEAIIPAPAVVLNDAIISDNNTLAVSNNSTLAVLSSPSAEISKQSSASWPDLPVPRLGVGQAAAGNILNSSGQGLWQTPAQNYLQTTDANLQGGYQAGESLNAGLHFAGAYQWQGATESQTAQKDKEAK